MTSNVAISKKTYCIDYNNLCGGNDFAALTNNYDRCEIQNLVWSITDDVDRAFVQKAIFAQKRIDQCQSDDIFENALEEQVNLQKDYNVEKANSITRLPEVTNKLKGYNTTEIGVFMYFLCDSFGVYIKNDDYKTCDQKTVIPVMAKMFGYSESSFTDKLNLDFTHSATRKAMYKVAKDFSFLPKLHDEIMREYYEYEDDFLEKEKKKRK